MESENEWLNSKPQLYSVTISKLPTAADFHIEIQECKTKSSFDTGAQVSCISSHCYKESTRNTRISTNVETKVISADISNLEPIELSYAH